MSEVKSVKVVKIKSFEVDRFVANVVAKVEIRRDVLSVIDRAEFQYGLIDGRWVAVPGKGLEGFEKKSLKRFLRVGVDQHLGMGKDGVSNQLQAHAALVCAVVDRKINKKLIKSLKGLPQEVQTGLLENGMSIDEFRPILKKMKFGELVGVFKAFSLMAGKVQKFKAMKGMS